MSGAPRIDVRDMAIVHRTFRRAFTESAALIRKAPAPPAARVRFLADHVDFGLGMLHHHHVGEETLLYPKLLERRPERAPRVEDIEHEHRTIAEAIEGATAACAAWRADPSPATGEALAAALEHVDSRCQPHLDDEEREVVALAAETLTQQEWDELGEDGVAHLSPKQRPIAFGMLLEPLDAAERAYMMRVLPRPVRMLFPVLIARPWRKYATQLRSGA